MVSKNGIDLIKKFEGYSSKSYQDSVGVWTIGYGCTMWSDGKKVKEGQVIDLTAAEKLLQWEVEQKTKAITALLAGVPINQNQLDAVISFTYNLGVGAFTRSTLLKKIKANPADPAIRDEFMKWNKAGGVVLKGLTRRREAEANLYFTA